MKIKILLFLICCLGLTAQARFERVPTQTRALLQGHIKQIFAHNRELCKNQLLGSKKALDSCYYQKPILGGLLTRKTLRFSLFGPIIASRYKQNIVQLEHGIKSIDEHINQLPFLNTSILALVYQDIAD